MTHPFITLQNLLPRHALTRLAGRAAASERPWIKRPFIHTFARAYDVNMAEAEGELDTFASFNDFFTRALTPGARTVDARVGIVVSPSDGVVSQAGRIEAGSLLQAKGNRYSIESLAGSLADGFDGGDFVTVYLAPHDYHRVHTPAEATLQASEAIPGELFSVNARTEAGIANLFCRNERLVCRLQSAEGGDLLLIMVGALIVGSIETAWEGAPASPYARVERRDHDVQLARGDEFGRFLLGSTVILCFQENRFRAEPGLTAGRQLRMGEAIGAWVN